MPVSKRRRQPFPLVSSLEVVPDRFLLESAEVTAGDYLRLHTREEPLIHGKLEVLPVGTLRLSRSTATAHVLKHLPLAGGHLELSFQMQGICKLSHAEGSTGMAPGFWVLCDADSSYTWINASPVRRLAWHVPRALVERRGELRSAAFMRAYSANSGVSRVLLAASVALLDSAALIPVRAAQDLSESFLRLIGLTLSEPQNGSRWRNARVGIPDLVRAYIAENLADPALSLKSIADALGKSARTLQRAMQGEEQIPDLVRNERLERIRSDLQDPLLRHRSISEIANSWGFRSTAHFSRAFRARYGMKASLARRVPTGS